MAYRASTGSSRAIFSADPPGLVISSMMSLTVASMAARTAVMVAGSPATTTSRCAPFAVTMRLSVVSLACAQLPMDWKGKLPSVPFLPTSVTPRRVTSARTDATFEPCLSRM